MAEGVRLPAASRLSHPPRIAVVARTFLRAAGRRTGWARARGGWCCPGIAWPRWWDSAPNERHEGITDKRAMAQQEAGQGHGCALVLRTSVTHASSTWRCAR